MPSRELEPRVPIDLPLWVGDLTLLLPRGERLWIHYAKRGLRPPLRNMGQQQDRYKQLRRLLWRLHHYCGRETRLLFEMAIGYKPYSRVDSHFRYMNSARSGMNTPPVRVWVSLHVAEAMGLPIVEHPERNPMARQRAKQRRRMLDGGSGA